MSSDQPTKEEQLPVDGYYGDDDLCFDEDELDLSFLDDDDDDEE